MIICLSNKVLRQDCEVSNAQHVGTLEQGISLEQNSVIQVI